MTVRANPGWSTFKGRFDQDLCLTLKSLYNSYSKYGVALFPIKIFSLNRKHWITYHLFLLKSF